MLDDESEPGSWKLALELGPWRKIGKNTYTNKKEINVRDQDEDC